MGAVKDSRDYVSLQEYAVATGVPACLLRAGAKLAGITLPEVEGVTFVDEATRPGMDRVRRAFVDHVPGTGVGPEEWRGLRFGERLARVMKWRGETQYSLAKKTPFHQSRFSLWIRGVGLPTASQAFALSRALDVPFVMLAGPDVEVEAVPDADLDGPLRRLEASA